MKFTILLLAVFTITQVSAFPGFADITAHIKEATNRVKQVAKAAALAAAEARRNEGQSAVGFPGF